MCEMIIENGIIIDDVERMMEELNELTEKEVKDADLVKKFVCSEKNTKFYIDERLKASINQDTGSKYLWLDTGFCDKQNRPIFISLLRSCGEYVGHFVGTAKKLMESVKGFFPAYSKHIKVNFARFLQKYDEKSKEREIVHILDGQEYFLSKANGKTEDEGAISKMLKSLNVAWAQDEIEVIEVEELVVEEEALSTEEEEITIALLVEKLEELESYNKYLVELIDSKEVQSDETIRCLQEKNKEYEEVIMRMRLFNENEQVAAEECRARKEEKKAEYFGHNLLGRNKQILVLGNTEIRLKDMQSIAKKDFGFEKGDFEFITDYDKVVHAAKRVQNSGRYDAIIFGCCPHKVKNNSWSSIIEQYRNCAGDLIAVDARTQNGNLKVTKESYRKALDSICKGLCLSVAVA